MLTRTSESAIHALLYLANTNPGHPTPPGIIAAHINASPTYLAKITSMLVKAGILTAYRGVNGGVRLNRTPNRITLLDVVQACQKNTFRGLDCTESQLAHGCAYHRAMHEVHSSVTEVLAHWTIADIMAEPLPTRDASLSQPCRMSSPQTSKGAETAATV